MVEFFNANTFLATKSYTFLFLRRRLEIMDRCCYISNSKVTLLRRAYKKFNGYDASPNAWIHGIFREAGIENFSRSSNSGQNNTSISDKAGLKILEYGPDREDSSHRTYFMRIVRRKIDGLWNFSGSAWWKIPKKNMLAVKPLPNFLRNPYKVNTFNKRNRRPIIKLGENWEKYLRVFFEEYENSENFLNNDDGQNVHKCFFSNTKSLSFFLLNNGHKKKYA